MSGSEARPQVPFRPWAGRNEQELYPVSEPSRPPLSDVGSTSPPGGLSYAAGESGSDSGRRWTGRWPLAFIAVALGALSILPLVQERRIAEVEETVTGVLEPAGRRASELTLVVAQQMARFQGYLLTGDEAFARAHLSLLLREQQVQDSLDVLADRAGIEIATPMAALQSASTQWHLGHEAALRSDSLRRVYIESLPQEQARYDAVLRVAAELEAAVQAEVRSGRTEMQRARRTQSLLTTGLAFLALAATALLGVVWRRLQGLVVTADARRQEALEARREMQAVLEASADGVLGIDLEGRCTSLNRTGSDLLGFSEVRARGRNVHELLHRRGSAGESHAEEECPLLKALRSGTLDRQEDDVIHRQDGSTFPARWHLRALVEGRDVRGAVLTITDMSDVREAEKGLRRAVKARDEMVAVVSHDLRNPLATVVAATDLMREIDLTPEEQQEQVETVLRAAQRMSRLIEDLLDVARMEAGAMAVDPRSVDVEPLVDEALDLIRGGAGLKKLELEKDVAPGLPPVRADRHRILQVFSNLLGNALKFTPEGGRIRIVAREVPGGVAFRVEDTGRGIRPEALEHLFDRFWQVERGDRTAGAGLGLAIVKGVLDAHEAPVQVESEVGKGTTFRFVLRRAEEGEDASRLTRSGVAATPGAPPPGPS